MALYITTRYQSHAGSNVGDYVARFGKYQRTVRADQELSSRENHERAARKLADAYGLTLGGMTATITGYQFPVEGAV